MKNIVICLDGTWNKPDECSHEESGETNVKNLYELLEKSPSKQVVYYDSGVGSQWYDRIRGGISGRGLAKNIQEAYYEVCKNYEVGDRVFIFGFSRGAYAARSLSGMIYSCGLLENNNLTDKSIRKAIDVYKKSDKHERELYKAGNRRCEIEVLGVWDTVGALGIPVNFFKKYTNKTKRLHFFRTEVRNTDLNQISNFQNSYLGFCVLRPTRIQKVVNAIIKPIEDKNKPPKSFVLCQEDFPVEININNKVQSFMSC